MTPGTAVIRISSELDTRLTRLADATGRSKSYYASKAIARYLEDREAVQLDISAIEDLLTPQSIETMRKELASHPVLQRKAKPR
jgi:RHH-type rel operon transcriptional repressor/antitoxin RelB